MSNWIPYVPGGGIPIEQFGKDHWSTFAYLETCAADHGGVVSNARMRCHPRLHREFAYDRGFGINDGSAYPTRLKDGALENHDDWSCLEDMAAAGLLTAEFRVVRSSAVGNSEARIRLTEKGQEIAARLRAHKAAGGSFSNFGG
jgi:hypothetical protein